MIWLTVLPNNNSILLICDHLEPIYLCIFKMKSSSYFVHSLLTILGSITLCHLSLHCLPSLSGRNLAIITQFYVPYCSTFSFRIWSSSFVHYVQLLIYFVISSTFYCLFIDTYLSDPFKNIHLLKHLISVLFGMNLQSLCQD